MIVLHHSLFYCVEIASMPRNRVYLTVFNTIMSPKRCWGGRRLNEPVSNLPDDKNDFPYVLFLIKVILFFIDTKCVIYSHHVICLQRSQFSSLSVDMNTGFFYAYPSESLWIVFANSYLSVLHSNNGCRSWIPSSQVLYVLIHFTISQIDLMDSSSEREDFHCFSFKVWRCAVSFFFITAMFFSSAASMYCNSAVLFLIK